ncbi:MAG: hypothetical protein HQL67_06700 [Magnetococcales bacterium]|nr:hypothetical protein [Magnetococcales bacterium]
MSESGTESNVLFQNYGAVVDSFFADGQEAGTPINPIPSSGLPRSTLNSLEYDYLSGPGAGTELEVSQAENSSAASLTIPSVFSSIPKDTLQKTQEMIDSFRRILAKESIAGGRGQLKLTEEEQVLTNFLKEFRKSLALGDESLLEANPFYELAKQIYKMNLDGVAEAFKTVQHTVPTTSLQPVPVSRSLKQIWRSANVGKHVLDKLSETFGKWVAFFRTPLSLLLFVGSTFTTARGVNDILQMTDVVQFFGEYFQGSGGENNRYLVSVSCGLILSSAILDYKTRIFQSIVESGAVLTGIRHSFLRNPRWMILATLLTFVSIKTNYDGIVSIISKKEDLAQQSQLITTRVRKALGSPFFMNPLEPDSLFDLQGSFQETTKEIMRVFRSLPEDEVKGVASSGDPRKGPRYWAKHFIVHGGYEEGVNDVRLAFNDHIFARRIDGMLKNSGIDFSTSFSQKVELLRAGYEAHLNNTDDLVHKRLGELNALMSMSGYSLDEIKRVLTLEHYQINNIVQDMVTALEANKEAYKQTAEDFNQLTNSYLGILQQVDKSGTSGLSAYEIKTDVVVPRIDAIDELREGKIPIAKHKNFEELRSALMEKYGVSLGGLILSVILFFSISMDLGDPIIYARMTARRGKKDRALFNDRLEKLKQWEEKFLNQLELFFEQRDVQKVFCDPMGLGETLIRNAFFKQLEKIYPELKENLDKTTYQKFDHWFRGMFYFSRTSDMSGLNLRIKAIKRILTRQDRFSAEFGVLIYPGFRVDKSFMKTTFLEWYDILKGQLNEQKVGFYQELRDAVKVQASTAIELPKDLSPAQKRLTKWAEKKGVSKLATSLMWGQKMFYTLFESSAMEAIPSFSYTRRRWLQDASENSLESEKIVETIYGFIPDLKKVVFETLPAIQEDFLEPVLDFLARHPSYEGINSFLDSQQLQKRFDETEKEALDLWGVSFFASDDPGGYLGLSSIIGPEELSNLQEMVEKTGNDSLVFSTKVSQLATDMERAFQQSIIIEEMNQLLSDVRGLCIEINQSLMKIKMRAWEYRSGSDKNINSSRELEFQAPKEADSILAIMEAILSSEYPYTQKNLRTVREMKQQAADLHDRIMAFVEFGRDMATPALAEGFSVEAKPRSQREIRMLEVDSSSLKRGPDEEPIEQPVIEGESIVRQPLSSEVRPRPLREEGISQPRLVREEGTCSVRNREDDPRVARLKAAESRNYAQQFNPPEFIDFAPEPDDFPEEERIIDPVQRSFASGSSLESSQKPQELIPAPHQKHNQSIPVANKVKEQARQEPRRSHTIPVVYESSRGALFEGESEQISKGGLDFISVIDPSMLPIGNEGTIQLLVLNQVYRFSVKVVRVSGSRIVVRILEDRGQFEELVARFSE